MGRSSAIAENTGCLQVPKETTVWPSDVDCAPHWCLIQNVVQTTHVGQVGHFGIKCAKSFITMQSWSEESSKVFFPKG